MAVIEAVAPLSIFSSHSFYCSKFLPFPKQIPSLKFHISNSIPSLHQNCSFSNTLFYLCNPTRKLGFQLFSAVQEVAAEAETEESEEPNLRKKLYVANLPWSLTVADIKTLFAPCGTVIDVEIIKQKDGKSRGFAFVTMASDDESQAVLEKFDTHEVSGRIIRVEFAKRFKRPPPPPPPPTAPLASETRHILYVSNLAWKVRSTHLRELFSAEFNPVSSRVIFDSPTGRSAGYGFVSFGTKEEAEKALSAMDGKELMGRPIRLKFSEKNVDESGTEKKEEEISEGKPEE